VLISGCDLTSEAYKSAFGWRREILSVGTPRNDILFLGNASKVKEKLGLPKAKKVLLFAPTFRNDVFMSGAYQLCELDISRLLFELGERFGGEWCFVFRSHNLVMKEIEARGVFDKNDIINGNEHDDMAEYLLVSDALLADYSSSMFDFMLTGKPVFLYTPDLENYKNSERGFYFDIEETPFSIGRTSDGVLENIMEGSRYPIGADERTFRRYKQKYIYHVARLLNCV
jgi:CDP-glycerol glycerophosphotransferase